MPQEQDFTARANLEKKRRVLRRRTSRWLDTPFFLRQIGFMSQPIEAISHPSSLMMRLYGATIFSSNLFFWWAWSAWIPQPYENGTFRAVLAVGGLVLMTRRIANDYRSRLAAWAFNIVIWVQMPLFFGFMYWMNDNDIWLAGLCSVLVMYFYLTDWRIAVAGTFLALVSLLVLIFGFHVGHPHPVQRNHLFSIIFSGAVSWFLGISAASMRQSRVLNTATILGIMAHELRTPIASVSLIGESLERTARPASKESGADPMLQMHKAAVSLRGLTKVMNHHINSQIANARLLNLPDSDELVSASEVIREVVADYPFRRLAEAACVEIKTHQDFLFRGSRNQFGQVISNMISNALRAMQSIHAELTPGALTMEVRLLEGESKHGEVIISDMGPGIPKSIRPMIFVPFFSTNEKTGHGLGLPFCRQVITNFGGTIRLKDETGRGATFRILLPLVRPKPPTLLGCLIKPASL